MNICIYAFLAGITSLLGSGVYTAAYPLHDVSSIFVRANNYWIRNICGFSLPSIKWWCSALQ